MCGNNRSKDPHVSLHRFPVDKDKRGVWLQVFRMREDEVQAHMRVCSRHFPDGNASSTPDTTLGKRLSSPKKGPRAKRAKKREESKQLRFRDAHCVRAYKGFN